MNLDMLYIIAIGNSKSQISILLMQLSLYILSIDMSNPSKGLLISVFMSILISLVANFSLHYYNSDQSTKGSEGRRVRTLVDKKRVFKKIIIISYVVSLLILTFLYMIDLGISDYYIYSAPFSLLILVIIIMLHNESITRRYMELKSHTWVFDYNKTPTVKSLEKGKDFSIAMFDDLNKLVISESKEPINIENIFIDIPPGTKLVNNELKKPKFQVIDFIESFKYTSIGVPKVVYLKNTNKQEEKIFNLYMDILSKYRAFYKVDARLIDCSQTTIQINKEKVETYIGGSAYVKKFVPYEDTKIAFISIQFDEDLAALPVFKFVAKAGRRVTDYTLKKVKESLYVTEKLDGDNYIETDISYLQRYMSLNLEEYYPSDIQTEEYQSQDKFHSINEKIEDGYHPKTNNSERKKSLYHINVKGELVYLFLEDIATIAEFDELLVTKFINRDIKEILNKVKKTNNN